MDVQEIIKHLGLKPHPEGGFYKETYRSDEMIPANVIPPRYHSDKYLCTAIYYLLTEDSFSAMHRLQADELFHFYMGDPVMILCLYPDGHGETIILGHDIVSGHCPQCLIPHDVWLGARIIEGGRFALMGTTVAPGFNFEDLEMGKRRALIEMYPGHADLIECLTNNGE